MSVGDIATFDGRRCTKVRRAAPGTGPQTLRQLDDALPTASPSYGDATLPTDGPRSTNSALTMVPQQPSTSELPGHGGPMRVGTGVIVAVTIASVGAIIILLVVFFFCRRRHRRQQQQKQKAVTPESTDPAQMDEKPQASPWVMRYSVTTIQEGDPGWNFDSRNSSAGPPYPIQGPKRVLTRSTRAPGHTVRGDQGDDAPTKHERRRLSKPQPSQESLESTLSQAKSRKSSMSGASRPRSGLSGSSGYPSSPVSSALSVPSPARNKPPRHRIESVIPSPSLHIFFPRRLPDLATQAGFKKPTNPRLTRHSYSSVDSNDSSSTLLPALNTNGNKHASADVSAGGEATPGLSTPRSGNFLDVEAERSVISSLSSRIDSSCNSINGDNDSYIGGVNNVGVAIAVPLSRPWQRLT